LARAPSAASCAGRLPPSVTDASQEYTSGRLRAVNRHDRIASGLSDRAIALIVKRRAAAALIRPATRRTRCAPAAPPKQRRAGSRNVTSATYPPPFDPGYIRRARSSRTTHPHSWACDGVPSCWTQPTRGRGANRADPLRLKSGRLLLYVLRSRWPAIGGVRGLHGRPLDGLIGPSA
jgi:hypothetical protein